MSDDVDSLYRPDVHLAIERIGASIMDSSARVEIISSPKNHLNFKDNGNNYIYFLVSGEVELCNLTNNVIISNVRHPAVLGITMMFSEMDYISIKTISNVKLYRVDLVSFNSAIERKGLWKDISILFSWYLEIYLSREYITSNISNSYDLVRHYLETLWNEYQDCLEGISIFNFILSRTTISRSSVNKIIKDLSEGGYIKVRRGRLLFLKKLPAKY